MKAENELKKDGFIDQAKGKANQVVGSITGDKKQQAKGNLQEAHGKAESKAGEAIDDAKTYARS